MKRENDYYVRKTIPFLYVCDVGRKTAQVGSVEWVEELLNDRDQLILGSKSIKAQSGYSRNTFKKRVPVFYFYWRTGRNPLFTNYLEEFLEA